MSAIDTVAPMNPEPTPAGKGTSVVADQAKPDAPKKGASRTLPKWELDARERVKAAIKSHSKTLADMVARDANEGDTRVLVTEFLVGAFGFDRFSDLTMEYQVKGEFADYGVRIDKQLTAFIEVKRVATKLDAKHLRQVEMYAVNEGVEWVILTNAVDWRVYHIHITDKLPVQIELALDVNLLSEESLQHKSNQLYYLTRESMKHRQLDELWKAIHATSPKSFAKVLLSKQVVDEIRKELKRQTGHNVDAGEIISILKETILRSECFEK